MDSQVIVEISREVAVSVFSAPASGCRVLPFVLSPTSAPWCHTDDRINLGMYAVAENEHISDYALLL